MHPILLYLLKMLLCSGILYGYYRVALYNERFHQWNRFYLLGAMVLSVVVPLVEIPLVAAEQPQGLIYVIETLPATIVAKAVPIITTEQIVWSAVLLVSLVLLLRLAWGIYLTIYKPYRHGEVSSREDIDVVITETPSAPYSFFRLLFWRSDMDPDSPHGKRVLLHELTHIREKHSADKLFVELLLVVYWFNPFFWLIRKELYVIHEFLADRKAIEQNNGAAFAEMILQTMNAGHLSPLTNPFFSSHLKRRLKMITTSKKPQFTYLRRISALVAMVTLSFVLMLTIEKGMAQQAPPPPPPPRVAPPPPPPPPPPPQKISLPDSIKSIEVNTVNGQSMVTIRLKNGKVRKMPVDEAIKKGYPVPPPPPPAPAPPAPPAPPTGESNIFKSDPLSFNFEDGKEPLFVYAGLVITREQLNQINTDVIESIDVLKGESAMALYGKKGGYGVIIITPKAHSKNLQVNPVTKENEVVVSGYQTKPDYKEVVVQGYQTKPDNKEVVVPGYQTKPDYKEVVVTGYQTRPDPKEVVEVGYGSKKQASSSAEPVKVVGTKMSNGENQPLIVIEEKIISQAEMNAIDPGTIEQVRVLKGQKAIEAYGEKGKNGVVEIELKNIAPSKDAPEIIFTKAEQMPGFPGGSEGWSRHLQKNLRYPDKAMDAKIEGIAKVSFTVDVLGNLSDFEIIQNPGGGLGEEALRVIKDGPKWEPAEQNGKNVKAKVTQVVSFRLG